jgi:hypothetical protein
MLWKKRFNNDYSNDSLKKVYFLFLNVALSCDGDIMFFAD